MWASEEGVSWTTSHETGRGALFPLGLGFRPASLSHLYRTATVAVQAGFRLKPCTRSIHVWLLFTATVSPLPFFSCANSRLLPDGITITLPFV
jgi:hypothetical protein